MRDIPTPALVVDTQIMRANIERMAALARRCGVALRPHIKTHKIPQIARMQLEAGACGITVAKLGEAEVMAQAGIADIFMAFPLIGADKITRALALARRIRLILAVDSMPGAQALAHAAQAAGITAEVRLEVDTGLARTGAPYEQAAELALAISALPGLRLTGIYTYKGAQYQGKPTRDVAAAGREESDLMGALLTRLHQAGLTGLDSSGGSTPAIDTLAQGGGITEVRPGTYVFNDGMQVAFGVCTPQQCAAHIYATVVSRPTPQRVVIDGGSKTFAGEVGAGAYGLPGCATPDWPGLVFERMSEEHGMLQVQPGCAGPEVGQVLRLLPNHICTAINLQSQVYFQEGDTLRAVPVAARGKLQ